MMKRAAILCLLCGACAVLLGFNLLVAGYARSQGEMLLKQMPQGAEYDVLLLGNSTMARSVDAETVAKESGLRVLKLALGGVSAQEECLLLEEFFSRGNKAKRVVLGFHDMHLEGMKLHRWSELSGANNLGYFTDAVRMREVYELNALESAKVKLTSYLPMLVRRSNLWAKVEALRRRMSDLGMPNATAATADGRVEDFKFYPYLLKDREVAHVEMQALVESEAELSLPLQRILAACVQHGAKLVVLEMPLLSERVAICEKDSRWQNYRSYREQMLKEAGAQWLSQLRWSGQASDFADPVHMTEEAAVRFSKALAALL
jgi:hypothetical protein